MRDQYVADLHWAAKAVFGAACPVCGGVTTFVQVEPHPDDKGLEVHTLKCQACGPTDSWAINRQVAALLGAA